MRALIVAGLVALAGCQSAPPAPRTPPPPGTPERVGYDMAHGIKEPPRPNATTEFFRRMDLPRPPQLAKIANEASAAFTQCLRRESPPAGSPSKAEEERMCSACDKELQASATASFNADRERFPARTKEETIEFGRTYCKSVGAFSVGSKLREERWNSPEATEIAIKIDEARQQASDCSLSAGKLMLRTSADPARDVALAAFGACKRLWSVAVNHRREQNRFMDLRFATDPEVLFQNEFIEHATPILIRERALLGASPPAPAAPPPKPKEQSA